MSELKCPFCKEEIISDLCLMFDKKNIDFTNGRQIYKCNKCGLFGTKELWQELIRTRKALEIAKDAIDKGEAALIGCQEADDKYISDVTAEDGLELMGEAYKKITALEQKDVK